MFVFLSPSMLFNILLSLHLFQVTCDALTCGTNAKCVVSNHAAACECDSGFQPNPDPATGCAECTQDSHCTGGQTCENNSCVTKCTQDSDCSDTQACNSTSGNCEDVTCDSTTCVSNASCQVANHAASCSCNTDYYPLPDADTACVSCTEDSHCATGQACVNNECSCGANSDCKDTQTCENGVCTDVSCDTVTCGVNAQCQVASHAASCVCDTGFYANPDAETECAECLQTYQCAAGQVCQSNQCVTTCSLDSECADTESCQNGLCKAVTCDSVTCATNAQCGVSNHAASCSCDSGFHPNPDAETACVPCTEDSHCAAGQTCTDNQCSCSTDSDCTDTQTCANGECQEVSCDNTSCGANAKCVVSNHAAACQCDTDYYPNATPEDGCVVCTQDSHCATGQTCTNNQCSCGTDSDCLDTQTCSNGVCEDVTCDSLTCGANAACQIASHAASCQCDTGFYPNTNPVQGCAECTVNSHCTDGKKCEANVCVTPCTQNSECSDTQTCSNGQCEEVSCDLTCGTNAKCVVSSQAAACQCDSGFQPNPDAATGCAVCTEDSHCTGGQTCVANQCVTTCNMDSECADTEACVNNQCTEVCLFSSPLQCFSTYF